MLLIFRDCKKFINRVVNLMCIFYESLFIIDDNNMLLRFWVFLEIIFIVGGWLSSGVVEIMEIYDKNVDCWYVIKLSMFSFCVYYGMVFMDGSIFIIGGFDGNQYFNSVYCFFFDDKMWEERVFMYIMRCYVSVVELNGKVLIVKLKGYQLFFKFVLEINILYLNKELRMCFGWNFMLIFV